MGPRTAELLPRAIANAVAVILSILPILSAFAVLLLLNCLDFEASR
jgi:hypothetical protein